MLERAPACLEHGGRRLLARPSRSCNAQRALHSTFWRHGAGEIDLPPWWIALLQRPMSEPVRTPPPGAGTAQTILCANFADSNFLDFLYPAKTLAFLHKLALRDARRPKAHLRTTTPRLSRLYSSTTVEEQSKDDNYPALSRQSVLHQPGSDHGSVRGTKTGERFPTEIGRTVISKAHLKNLRAEMHSLHKEIIGDQHTPLPRIDVDETSLNRLAEKVQKTIESHSEYLLAILDSKTSRLGIKGLSAKFKAHYHLNQFANAMDLYRDALDRHQDHAATPALVRLALDFEDWNLAYRGFQIYKTTLQDQTYFWRELYKTEPAVLVTKSRKLAEYVMSILKTNQPPDGLADFGVQFLEHSLNQRYWEHRAQIPPRQFSLLFQNLKDIKSPAKLTYEQYQASIYQLLESADHFQTQLSETAATVIREYNEMRQHYEVVPEQYMLERLLSIACKVHHYNMMRLYQELKDSHGVPDLQHATIVLAELEYQGDVDGFRAVIEDCRKEHGQGWTSSRLLQLLRILAKRRQPQEAKSAFDSIQQLTGVPPTLSHWNALVAAFSVSNDLSTALNVMDEMSISKIEPDLETYRSILAYHARRGDTKALNQMSQCLPMDVLKPVVVTQAYVQAHIANLELDEAAHALRQSLDTPVAGSHGPMWGSLFRAYAKLRMFDKMNALADEMARANIPEGLEYCEGLIIGYGWRRRAYRAYKVVNDTMPGRGLLPSAYHYAMVMSIFISTGQFAMVPEIEAAMMARGIAPDFNVKTMVLRAAARFDMRMYGPNWGKPVNEVVLSRAEATLDEVLRSSDRKDMAIGQGKSIIGGSYATYDEAFLGNYFHILINSYAQKGAWRQAGQVYNRFVEHARAMSPNQEVEPPLKLIGELMRICRHDDSLGDAADGWKVALSKAQKTSVRSNGDINEPQWVLPAHRFYLSIPLTEYITSLFLAQKFGAVESLIHDVQRMGFELDSRNWNTYVQGHAAHGDAHTAFAVAERELIAGWGRWPRRTKLPTRKFIGALDWRDPREHETLRRRPTYKTMVLLASAYVRLREQWAVADRRSEGLQELLAVAPRTVEAVTLMPRRNDRFQRLFLPEK